jgi:hypothetical protein
MRKIETQLRKARECDECVAQIQQSLPAHVVDVQLQVKLPKTRWHAERARELCGGARAEVVEAKPQIEYR